MVVGLTAEGLRDLFTTPFGEGRMPGAEVHANVIDALLSGRAIAPATPWQRLAVTLTPALAIAAVGALAAPWVTAVGALAAAAGGGVVRHAGARTRRVAAGGGAGASPAC